MSLRGRLAKLERWAEATGLNECPGCQARLRGEIPMTTTDVRAGEPMPEPDHCPVCSVEWPRLTMEIVGATGILPSGWPGAVPGALKTRK